MFIIVKSKKTEKCKVVSFIEDMNPNFVISGFTNNNTNKSIYRIQYKTNFWLMGFCRPLHHNKNEYCGESNMLRTLKFDNKDDCERFLKYVNDTYSAVRSEFNKDLEVII